MTEPDHDELSEDTRKTRRLDRARASRRRAVFGIVAITLLLLAVAWIVSSERIADPGVPPVAVVKIITGPGTGENPDFKRPLAAAWGRDGDVLVSDTENKRIVEFAADWSFVREFGAQGTKATTESVTPVPLEMPVGLDVSAEGEVYVADLRGGRVAIYDSAGRFRRTFAPPNSADWRPTDVAVGQTRVYVTDQTGVEVFDRMGVWLERLPIDGQTDGLSRPNGIAVGKDGTIYVSDTNRFRILAVDASGTVVYTTAQGDSSDRAFGLPRGLGVFDDGTALVADAFSFAITEVDPSGKRGRRWGVQGDRPGRFNYPNDVDVSGELVLVTDKENHRVQVLRLRRE
ncbi:MAG: hypothetical protein U1E26_03195 [Coriobacteriia bacterium]|nr:hypothetical protein [Coriobacteriia bacterium]